MKPAISTLFKLHIPLKEAFFDFQIYETSHIEIVDAGPHTLNKENVNFLNDFASTSNIKYSVHAPYTDVNISAYDNMIREAILDRYEQCIKYCNSLNADIMVYHPGNTTALLRATPGSAWKKNIESSRKIFKIGEEYSVKPMIENVPEPFEFVMRSVHDFKKFYEEIDIPIDMVLDIAHANIRNEVFQFMSEFKNRIKHVHISDNFGDWDSHLPLGEGNISWDKVVQDLNNIGYDGALVIESYSDVKKSLEYLKSLLC